MDYELAPWLVQGLKLVIGALTGAFAGAWAAQGIAKRNADTQRDAQELRATSLAISTAISIVNVMAALKRQHVLPMVKGYADQCIALELARKKKAMPLEFEANLMTLMPITTGLPTLEKLLVERVSIPPGAMGLYALMAQSIANLNGSLAGRNDAILALKAKTDLASPELAELYFGLPNKHGHSDTRFPDSVRAIGLYTDDTILLGYLLAKELMKHLERLVRAHRGKLPPLAVPDFKTLEDTGLVPPIGEAERKMLRSLQLETDVPPEPAK